MQSFICKLHPTTNLPCLFPPTLTRARCDGRAQPYACLSENWWKTCLPTSSPEITLNATKPAENASHFSLVTRRFSGAGLHDRNVHRADSHATKNTDRKADSPLAYFTYRATPRVREKRYKGDPFQHRARSIFAPSVNPPTAEAATRTLPSLAIRSPLNRSDFASFFFIYFRHAPRETKPRDGLRPRLSIYESLRLYVSSFAFFSLSRVSEQKRIACNKCHMYIWNI